MKRDPYKNQERWTSWKEKHFKHNPKGIRKEDWVILVKFLKDMELGLNTPKGMKGQRDVGTLLNLSAHNQLFLKNFSKPLTKITKIDLHNLEKDITQGKILKRNKQKFGAFGNYVKDFKVFWHWGIRTKVFKEDVTEDITSKTDKPDWVYLTEEQIKQFFNKLDFEHKVYCFFLLDSGMRVTEANSIQINNFSKSLHKLLFLMKFQRHLAER